MKPLLFLDVDGVLNDLNALYYIPNPRPADGETFWHNGKPFRFFPKVDGHYDIVVPEKIIEPLRELVERCETHWLSTWRTQANLIGERIGLPRLPAFDDGTMARHVNWKWPAVREMVIDSLLDYPGRLIIWIEDGHPWEAVEFTLENPELMLVDTTETYSLSPEKAKWLLAFLDNAEREGFEPPGP